MKTLNDLSPRALSAAMRGGSDGWGTAGSAERNIRYSETKPPRPGRRRTCHCGCNRPTTHAGMANGVCLVSACELGIARWVRTGYVRAVCGAAS